MTKVSTEELQIAERAKKYKGEALHNLHEYIDESLLERSYRQLNKNSAVGVDGENWYEFGINAKERIPKLLSKFKAGEYKAPLIRRVYIPKGDGSQRPLGISIVEDKVLQGGVKTILEPIYEEDFKNFSYGFRPGRSPHQAIDYMYKEVVHKGMRYIIDADLKNYFGSIPYDLLRDFIARRVKDGVIRKMIDKWLKAGVLDKGQITYPEEGTPQGSICKALHILPYAKKVLMRSNPLK